MTFLDEILAAVRDLPLLGSPLAQVDLRAPEAHLFAAFEQREQAEEGPGRGLAARDARAWSRPGVARSFFLRLGAALAGGDPPEPVEDLQDELDAAVLACVWGDLARVAASLGGSQVRAQHLFALVSRVNNSPNEPPPSASVLRYLSELGTIVPCPAGWALTASGRVLATLAGPNLRRWLLHLEVRQSLGPTDPWRVHASALAELLKAGTIIHESHPAGPEEELPWAPASLQRLARLGVVTQDTPEWTEFTLTPEARALVEELLGDPPSPMAVLADTLCRDAHDQALAPWLGSAASPRATDHLLAARMVAHEIRNAIVPVQTTITHLFEDAGPALAAYGRQRARIDAGLSRALEFASEQLRTAKLGTPPPSTFPLGDAIRNAVRMTEAERNGRVTVHLDLPETPAFLLGDRALFERALVNLLRNAAQAQPTGPVHIDVTLRVNAGEAEVYVDDDGPGVAEHLREEIFRPGVSSTGSTGQGLVLARTVVNELRGQLWCEGPPRGGARFRMHFPNTRTSP